MTEVPAVRVIGRGGGDVTVRVSHRERCLTQGRELDGRVNGLAHHLAERALLRAAGGHRGEHVFGKLVPGPDGIRTMRGSKTALDDDLALERAFAPGALQAFLHRARDAGRRPSGDARPPPQWLGGQRPPIEAQISTFVRTFSITASVNSVVEACPPRSTVFTPPAVVSSTLS
jgi:hypothetical protein